MLYLSKAQARALCLKAQLLHKPLNTKEIHAIEKTIQQLGYIQIDSISVIERAHHHILFTRRADYDTFNLHQLTQERKIFEYWTHAASFIPIDYYRFYLKKMNRVLQHNNWYKKQYSEHHQLLKKVLKEIELNGPMGAKDFKSQKNRPGGWWNWKPAKIALEMLYWNGELMVTERRNFQKIYDIRERVLPTHVNTNLPEDHEITRFHLIHALKAMGVATSKQLSTYLLPQSIQKVRKGLQHLMEENSVIQCQLEGSEQNYYALVEPDLKLQPFKDKIVFLSPFDNLTIQRERLQEIFDFNYVLECYVPKAKRRYGYLSHIVLWKDQMIGMIDFKADRKNKRLLIQALTFTRDIALEPIKNSFPKALNFMAKFNKCHSIEAGDNFPQQWLKLLK